jgi:hypothetical protein
MITVNPVKSTQHKSSVPSPQKTYFALAIKESSLMPLRKIKSLCSAHYTKPVNRPTASA